jgi:hypothetical protein
MSIERDALRDKLAHEKEKLVKLRRAAEAVLSDGMNHRSRDLLVNTLKEIDRP